MARVHERLRVREERDLRVKSSRVRPDDLYVLRMMTSGSIWPHRERPLASAIRVPSLGV